MVSSQVMDHVLPAPLEQGEGLTVMDHEVNHVLVLLGPARGGREGRFHTLANASLTRETIRNDCTPAEHRRGDVT